MKTNRIFIVLIVAVVIVATVVFVQNAFATATVVANSATATPDTALAQSGQENSIPVTGNEVSATLDYHAALGKSLNDREVADFIFKNNCSSMVIYELCPQVGMSLLLDSGQKMVQGVFLYSGNADGFEVYKGELPYGLAFTDTMEMVEQKFSHPVEIHAPQAGWDPGLPDIGGTTDHFHYSADYKRFGLTIIYNSPSPSDKGATIQSILIHK